MQKINDTYADLIIDKYKQSYILWLNGRNTLAFSSHQPVIIHLLNSIPKGDVIEFGIGYNSTPIFHTICGFQNRKLLSVDTDKNWHSKFISYQSTIHDVKLVDPKKIMENSLFDNKYSIAFVDGAPAGIRQPFLEKINADYIIVHDTECVVQNIKNVYAFDFSMFKQVFHFKTVPPMTSLVSNLENIDLEITKIFDE